MEVVNQYSGVLPRRRASSESLGKGLIHGLSRPVALIAVGFGLIGLHVSLAAQMYPLTARILAALISFAAYFALLKLLLRPRREELPFRELYIVLFYIYFGFPIFSEDQLTLVDGIYIPSDEGLNGALLAAVISLSVFLLFFPLGRKLGLRLRRLIAGVLPKGMPTRSAGRLVLFVITPVVVFSTYINYLFPEALPISVRYMSYSIFSPMLLLAVVAYLSEAGQSKYYRYAMLLMFTVSVFLGLLQGMLGTMLLPIVVVVAIQWLWGKRFPLIWVGVALLLFFILNPAKMAYRKATWNLSPSEKSALSLSDRLAIWEDAVLSSWSMEKQTGKNVDDTFNRMSDLLPVAQVIDMVPASVPYGYGESWIVIPYSFVPRVFWPGKPDMTLISNGLYAVTMRRMTEQSVRVTDEGLGTGVNIPQLADGYWNFGWLGVLLVAALIGIIVGLEAGVFSTKHWATCSIGMLFFIRIQPQSELNSFVVGATQIFIGAFVLLWLIYWGGKIAGMGRLPHSD
jgi:hypothetical protein